MKKKKLRVLSLVIILTLILSNLIGIRSIQVVKAATNHVVISQVFGGGGNSGAPYSSDFIELYNPTDYDVDLTGWSLQYASATGTFSTNMTVLSGTVKSHGYYLCKCATGTVGAAIPTPDATCSINMSGTAGKVALSRNNTAVSGINDTNLIDFVGYGTTANAYEGTGAAKAPSNTTSIQRMDNNGVDPTSNGDGNGNGWDSDNNSNDFVVSNPVRMPKNTSSATEGGTTTPTTVNVTGIALDKNTLSLTINQTAQLTATIAPANATNSKVNWSSDNTAVATVTNGVVKGVSEGSATITATSDDGGYTSLCKVTVTANAPPVNKTFDLVEITDFHGQLLDSTNTKQVGAALAYAVKGVTASNPNRTLVIGGGDLYQGTPTSNVLHGVPVQKVMSNLGMEVTALGNHEFDWGLDAINNETMIGANYQIVCANMYNKGTNTRIYNPYKIITKDGVRIAVIGAILKDAPTIILPANVANYDFRDVASEVNNVAADIRTNNLADVVIAVVHDGGSSLDTIVNNLHGVDAVFGGHTHTTGDVVDKDADGKDVPTLNACNAGKGYIDLKITVNPSNKVVGFSSKGTNWYGLTVTTSTPVDPDCKKIVDDASAALLPIFNEVIGHDDASYTSTQVDSPYGESQLGNWMADVVRNYASADVGMVNNGGIRLSPIPAGDITVGTIFNLMPFDNTVCTATMTGAQLKFLFEQAVQDNGKGIQISGVRFIYDSTKPSYKPAVVAADGTITTPEVPGQRVTNIVREKDNSIVKDTDILKVAAPDFVATGGDTFTEFLDPSIANTLVDSHYTVRDALTADVRAKGKLTVVMNNRVDNQMAVVAPEAMTIAEARITTKKAVILTGIVSAVNGNNVFMQDDTAGICAYNSGGKTFSAKKGDKITVTGNLSLYNGLLEVTPTSASNVVLISSGNPVTPKVVTVGAITDALQGQLIKVKDVKFTSIDNSGASMAQDSTGSINVFKMPVVAGLNVGDFADVTAAVTKYGTSMELAVDSPSDVVVDKTPPVITVYQVVDGKAYNTDVDPVVTVDDDSAVLTETLNGKSYNGEDITSEGAYVLKVVAVDIAGNESDVTVNFTIDKTAPVITVSNLQEGKAYNTNVIPKIAIDDNTAAVTVTLNGAAYDGQEIAAEGAYVLSVTAVDPAGNAANKTVSFIVDKTAPVIATNVKDDSSFERINTFTIINSAEDSNSGLDVLQTTLDGTAISNNYVLNLESLAFGNHKLVITAKDKAGNISNKEINFTVTATIKTLSSFLDRFYNEGLIKNKGIYNSLATKVDKGNLVPFINDVLAQGGKGIDENAADVLKEYANWIISR